jgi:hypothetical protein
VVFTPGLWQRFEPMLRADFRLFDEYEHPHPPAEADGLSLAATRARRQASPGRQRDAAEGPPAPGGGGAAQQGAGGAAPRGAPARQSPGGPARGDAPAAASAGATPAAAAGTPGHLQEHLHGARAAERAPPPFDFPLTVFYGSRDGRVTEELVRGWASFAGGAFEVLRVEGGHLFPLEKGPKQVWLRLIAERLEQHMAPAVRE